MKKILPLALLFACQAPSQPPKAHEETKPASVSTNQAPATTQAAASAPASKASDLPWFEDDPAAALAAAREAGKPVLVDLWAPWCHTCIAMKGHILTAKNLTGLADRFVFLAVNTEREGSAPFLQTYPVEVWPTFYVVDPKDGAVRGRWLGAASVEQLRGFLSDSHKAFEVARAGQLPPGDPLALLIAGDQAAAQRRYPEALDSYAAALKAAPADWPRRPDALVASASALRKKKDYGACVDLGLASMQETGRSASATDFAVFTLACAEKLDAKDPRVEKLRRAAEARLAALVADREAPLSVDDRSDAYRNLWDLRETLGDAPGAKAAAEARRTLLEEGMRGEPDEIALAYDYALSETYLYLGRPDDALSLLTKREAALPKNYNPPHYLARTYHQLKREEEALAAIERAVSLAYGPRRAGMLGLKADILEALGKRDEARAAIEEQLRLYRELPEGQKLPEREASTQARLDKLSAPAK